MGCDYYIVKCLNIYYNDNDDDYYIIKLEITNGYYYLNYDEDEIDYTDKMNEYIKNCLIPKSKPIIIYANNCFNKENYEIKYKTLIENKINEHGKKWCDITKIIKDEYRYERT